MRRLSEESPDSPVIEIRERQWVLRNWLLGGLTIAVLILAGLVYAGIRVNEDREHRNAALVSGQSRLAELKDILRSMEVRTSDARIAEVATTAAEGKMDEATARVARLSGKLAELESTQQRLFATLATVQETSNRLAAENETLRAELATSNGRIVQLQSELLADSLVLAEQNASLDRRLRTVADHTSEVDRRVGKSSTTLRGFGGVSVANFAVSLIHLLGTKQATDVKPSSGVDR